MTFQLQAPTKEIVSKQSKMSNPKAFGNVPTEKNEEKSSKVESKSKDLEESESSESLEYIFWSTLFNSSIFFYW